ncbi:hypothetical protein [Actinoplanes sp. NPDC051494]|uniref:hypothetical protein n=1 Tax=Actinoplanes sp. NPDC051494 TaxID=3363907 RepID=UPI003787475D
MTAQPGSWTFATALDRFHRPGLHAARLSKLAGDLLDEVSRLSADLHDGEVTVDGLRADEIEHLREVLTDIATYADETRPKIQRMRHALDSIVAGSL